MENVRTTACSNMQWSRTNWYWTGEQLTLSCLGFLSKEQH